MAIVEVKVPDIGDFKDVPVIEVLVKPGDSVKPEDPLVTLESDKATMDVPSPAAGTVKAITVKVGDKVSEGSALMTLESGAAASRTAHGGGRQGGGDATAAEKRRDRRRALRPRAGRRVLRAQRRHPPRARRRKRARHPALRRRPTADVPTSSAKCSCSVRVPAVTRRRFVPPISA